MGTVKQYKLTEIFYSLQGEGVRAGTAAVFVRFAGCNLKCRREGPARFNCDTDHNERFRCSLPKLLERVELLLPRQQRYVILTGGEPTLQADAPLVEGLHDLGCEVAVETNGTRLPPRGVDWVTCSPKRGSTVAIRECSELKIVLSDGEGLPDPLPVNFTTNLLISPAFHGPELPRKNLEWCIDLVKRHPRWRLSVQQHKWWQIR